MKSSSECPSMQGWITVRLTMSADSHSIESSAEECYLTLKDGYLKWFRDEELTVGLGCGFIVSKVMANEDILPPSASGGNGTSSHKKGSGGAVKPIKSISFQLLTKDGTLVMELFSPKIAIIKYWHALLDMHVTYCSSKKQLSHIPSYEWEAQEGNFSPSSLVIANDVTLDIEGQAVVIHLTLLDRIEDITNELIEKYQPSRDSVIVAHITLLQEQLKLAYAFIPKFRQVEKDLQNKQLEVIQVKTRLMKAEKHIQFLTKHLDNIEMMLPVLQEKVEASEFNVPLGGEPPLPTPPPAVPVEGATAVHEASQPVSEDEQQSKKSKSRTNSPSYSRSTTPTTTSWRVKYEQVQQELQQALEQIDTMKKDIQRQKKFSKSVQQIEALQHENRELREYSAVMRNQMSELQQQMEDLQRAAVDMVHELHHQKPQHVEKKHVGPLEINLDLTSFSNMSKPSRRSKRSQVVERYDHLETKDEEQVLAAVDQNPEEMDEEEDDDYPVDGGTMEVEDWTSKYQSLLGVNLAGNQDPTNAASPRDIYHEGNSVSSSGSATSSPHQSQLVQHVMKAIRWPLIEDRIVTLIYNYYAASGNHNSSSVATTTTTSITNGSDQVMSMTRFFRFAKDFHITMVEDVKNQYKNNSSSSSNKQRAISVNIDSLTEFGQSIANSTNNTLIYGEVSMIFTNAAKIETSDMKKRPGAFRVNGGNTSSSNRISHHVNNSITTSSAVLTRKQFQFAIEDLGERLYGHVIREVAGVNSENMTDYERKLAIRATLELLWIQILIPHAVIQDLIPWPLIYMQEFLVHLHQDDTIASLLQSKMHVLVHVYYQSCIDQAGQGGSSSMTVFSQQLHRLLQLHLSDNNYSPKKKSKERLGMMNFVTLSRIGRSYGLVPYLTGEHQLFSIFKELVDWSDDNHYTEDSQLRFPYLFPLPFGLMEAIQDATKEYLSQTLQSSSLLLTIWNNPPSSPSAIAKSKGNLSTKSVQPKEEVVDIVNFIITMGTVAMQAFSTSSAPVMRLDNLLQLLEKNVKAQTNSSAAVVSAAGSTATQSRSQRKNR